MILEHYISELLYRYNCVTVPELGAFLAQMKSAVIHNNVFSPPSKEISFNEQVVTNDGLLVSHIAAVKNWTYEETLLKVLACAEELKIKLHNKERISLNNIGELWLNENDKIQFQPHSTTNYLTASFGMANFISVPVTREVLKEEVESIEEKTPFTFTPEKRKEFSIRPYLKYAAIFLLAASAGLTALQFYKQNNFGNNQVVQEQVEDRISRHIQEATFFDLEPLELPSISLDVVSKSKLNEVSNVRVHHIIAGAFRFRKNADKKIRQLKRRGYNATYIGTNKHGLHMVNYDSYTDVNEALNALKNIKQRHSRDAWLLSSK